jgi:hypothetical protein
MDGTARYHVGEPDPAGFSVYSFTVNVNGRPYLYEIRARSLDDALAQLGEGANQEYRTMRELGGVSGAAALVTAFVGGGVLTLMLCRKIYNWLFGSSDAPPPGALQAEASKSAATPWNESEAEDEPSSPPDPFPWVAVSRNNVDGWRAGPPGEQHWRVVLYTDGEADVIRSEMAQEPSVNPDTQAETGGAVVYRFPLAAYSAQPVSGAGVIDVLIAPEPPAGDLSSLEIVAVSEDAAIKSLIEYFDALG